MYLADYHTHSRSLPRRPSPHDGDGPGRRGRAGLDEICFTDHVEPMTLGVRRTAPDPMTGRPWRRSSPPPRPRWGDRIRRCGWAWSWATPSGAPARTEQLLADAPELDFVIGSIHALLGALRRRGPRIFCDAQGRGGGPDRHCGLSGPGAQRWPSWGGFYVLGHLTLPLRYLNEMPGVSHRPLIGFEAEMRGDFAHPDPKTAGASS